MSEQNTVNIKQRIVGALVLVSLGVIIIPLLLNGGRDSNTSFLNKNIPEMPKKLTKALPAVPQPMSIPAPKTINVRPERVSANKIEVDNKPSELSSKQDSQSNSLHKTKVKSAPADKSKSISKTVSKKSIPTADTRYEKVTKPEKSSKIKMAYTLQIASFSEKNNAIALQNKLRKKKFKAYIESIVTTKGRIYRLRVGPYLIFEQITKIKKQIEIQFKLSNTIIVKYKTLF